MRALAFVLLALFAGAAFAAAHDTTLRLEFERGQCSGTAVGPHVILTAAHCVQGELVRVDGYPVTQDDEPILDKQDHALIHLAGGKFLAWSKVGPVPRQGSAVYLYGNPYNYPDLVRVGWVSGQIDLDTYFQIPVYPGDSGAGIFDKSGRVVAVVSATPNGRKAATGEWVLMPAFTLAKPMRFTAQQWRAASQ